MRSFSLSAAALAAAVLSACSNGGGTASAAQLSTIVRATGRPSSTSTSSPVNCVSRGELERRLAELVRRITRTTGYHRYEIPWDWMDLRDPGQPRALRREAELPRFG